MRRVLDSPAGWINRTEAEFVRLSVVRKKRLLVGTVSAVSVAFVVLSVLTLIAYYEQGRAVKGEAAAKKSEGTAKAETLIAEKKERIANSRRLASLSVSERNNRLDRSLLLAVEAVRAEDTFEARESLYQALQARPGLVFFLHLEAPVVDVAFSPDGKTLAAGYWGEGGVMMWDLATRKRLLDDPLPLKERRVVSLAYSPLGKSLAAGYADDANLAGSIVIWDVARRERRKIDPHASGLHSLGSVAFSPDGRTLAASCGAGVFFLDAINDKWLASDARPARPRDGAKVAFSPDGKTVAAGTGGEVEFWDVASRNRLAGASLLAGVVKMQCVAFSPDGKTLAAGYFGYNAPCGVVLWNVETREHRVLGTFPVPEGTPWSVAFSPDSKTIAAAVGVGDGRGGILLWDLAEGKRLVNNPLPVNEGNVLCAYFSPNGQKIAVGYGGGPGGTAGVAANRT